MGGTYWGAKLFSNPDTVRALDVLFVRADRLPGGRAPVKHRDGVRDLVVEVLSPSDRYRRTTRKVDEYLRAGAQLVIVIDPDERSAITHRPGHVVAHFDADGVIDCSPADPGFSLPLTEIWEDAAEEA